MKSTQITIKKTVILCLLLSVEFTGRCNLDTPAVEMNVSFINFSSITLVIRLRDVERLN